MRLRSNQGRHRSEEPLAGKRLGSCCPRVSHTHATSVARLCHQTPAGYDTATPRWRPNGSGAVSTQRRRCNGAERADGDAGWRRAFRCLACTGPRRCQRHPHRGRQLRCRLVDVTLDATNPMATRVEPRLLHGARWRPSLIVCRHPATAPHLIVLSLGLSHDGFQVLLLAAPPGAGRPVPCLEIGGQPLRRFLPLALGLKDPPRGNHGSGVVGEERDV